MPSNGTRFQYYEKRFFIPGQIMAHDLHNTFAGDKLFHAPFEDHESKERITYVLQQ